MKRAGNKNPAFRKKLEGQTLTFQISSQDGAVRHYNVKDMRVTSHSGKATNPSFEIAFKDSATGFQTLTAKNAQLAFMKGIQDKDIIITGDFSKVMWFQGLMKYLMPKKKKKS